MPRRARTALSSDPDDPRTLEDEIGATDQWLILVLR